MSIVQQLQQSVDLEQRLAGLPAPQRAAARHQARLKLAAERVGAVTADDCRQERLVAADVGRMSESRLIQAVQDGEEQGGFWGGFLATAAAERLEREFGYGWLSVDEERLGELLAGGE